MAVTVWDGRGRADGRAAAGTQRRDMRDSRSLTQVAQPLRSGRGALISADAPAIPTRSPPRDKLDAGAARRRERRAGGRGLPSPFGRSSLNLRKLHAPGSRAAYVASP
jgi:hypothetical protein